MIHSLEIRDFRLFKDVNLELGKYVTAISGKNALGKTTLLALLGNSCELKVSEGRPILQNQFRTQFGDIFKASEKFDLSGSDKCTINFSNLEEPTFISDFRRCRTTWQRISKNNINKRFRLIPEKVLPEGRKSSSKFSWPVLYLGLSRLYPIGESTVSESSVKNIKLAEDEKEYFINNYNNILSLLKEDEIAIDSISIGETTRKKGVGISTSYYESVCNSAGQDNIGQIILTVLSFKRLKEQNSSYSGGLILIDELDATLHPAAQIQLINYLIRSCKELNLQIVFTTHSLTIIEELYPKIKYNDINKGINGIEFIYITNDNGTLEVLKNPEWNRIYNDLNLSTSLDRNDTITIYSEDDEARWLITKLLSTYIYRFNIVKIKMGYSNLLLLNKCDYHHFSNILFVLDGDVKDDELSKYSIGDGINIIKLPGGASIEEVLYTYLENLPLEHPLLKRITEVGITKKYLAENKPITDNTGPAREKYKKWFNEYKDLFESFELATYWVKDNKDMCEVFIKDFKYKFNEIAKRNYKPLIN